MKLCFYFFRQQNERRFCFLNFQQARQRLQALEQEYCRHYQKTYPDGNTRWVSRLSSFSSQGLANSLWAFGSMRWYPTKVLPEMSRRADMCTERMRGQVLYVPACMSACVHSCICVQFESLGRTERCGHHLALESHDSPSPLSPPLKNHFALYTHARSTLPCVQVSGAGY
jgi:hypothetical protein